MNILQPYLYWIQYIIFIKDIHLKKSSYISDFWDADLICLASVSVIGLGKVLRSGTEVDWGQITQKILDFIGHGFLETHNFTKFKCSSSKFRCQIIHLLLLFNISNSSLQRWDSSTSTSSPPPRHTNFFYTH